MSGRTGSSVRSLLVWTKLSSGSIASSAADALLPFAQGALRSNWRADGSLAYDGRISVPVLSVHTTDDGLVVSPHEHAYRDAVRRAGRTRLLKQLWVDRPGHCTFTDAETLAALDVLLERLDGGRWPKHADADFADYEPSPFLRPFDLAWPRSVRPR